MRAPGPAALPSSRSRPGRPRSTCLAAPSGSTTTSRRTPTPNTGVAVYDTSNGNGGWNEVGGASASSPMLAAMFALAGSPGTNPGRRHLHPHGQLLRRHHRQRRLVQPGLPVHGRDRVRRPDRHRHPGRHRRPSHRRHRPGNTVTVTNPGNQTGTVGTAVSPADRRHRLGVRPDAHLHRQRAARRACRQLPSGGSPARPPPRAPGA